MPSIPKVVTESNVSEELEGKTHTNRQNDKEMAKHSERCTNRETYIQRDMHIERHTYRETYGQEEIHTVRLTGCRQASRQQLTSAFVTVSHLHPSEIVVGKATS